MRICRGLGKWYWVPRWLNTVSYKDAGFKYTVGATGT